MLEILFHERAPRALKIICQTVKLENCNGYVCPPCPVNPEADMRRKFINHQHGSALVYQTP